MSQPPSPVFKSTLLIGIFAGDSISFHPETPDEKLVVSDSERGIFCSGKEIKGLRGDVHRYVAQVSPQIDAARAEKNPFRMETN